MLFVRVLLVCLLIQSTIQNCLARNDFQQQQEQQISKQVSPEQVINGVTLVVEDNDHLVKCLEKILQPRVVGTAGHTKVQNFIVRELENLGFVTELEHFTAAVPKFQNLTFANIIGIHNPYAVEYIALACHYDSKYFPNDPNFVGAIDSAVPCAILLNVGKTLQNILINDFKSHQDLGLMLIFFDGEEAFENWSDIDSLYGSRYLANKLMSSTSHPTFRRDIDRLKVLILLDLIGSANPRFYSFNRNTHKLHTQLWHIERRLMQANLLETRNFMFSKRQTSSYVDDDHRPFQQQNVPILHLIPTPFPRVWHTADDNATNLHWPTIRSFNKIFQQFVYDLLRRQPRELNFRS